MHDLYKAKQQQINILAQMQATPSYQAKMSSRSPYERMRAGKQTLIQLQEKYRPETNRFNVYLHDKAQDQLPSP